MNNITFDTRQKMERELSHEVARDFLQTKGLAYSMIEYTLPILPGVGGYAAIASDGNRHPLSGAHLAVMNAMCAWVLTGRGSCPADSWRQKMRRKTATKLKMKQQNSFPR